VVKALITSSACSLGGNDFGASLSDRPPVGDATTSIDAKSVAIDSCRGTKRLGEVETVPCEGMIAKNDANDGEPEARIPHPIYDIDADTVRSPHDGRS
jgi:hypothetical protein